MKMKRYVFVFLVVSVFFVSIFLNSSFAIEEHPIGVAYGEMYRGEEFMPILHEIGVKRTKVSFRWNEIEPQEGVYDWQRVDSYVAQISPSDKVLLNVFTTGWGTNKESYKGATIKGPRYYKAYRDFIVNLVKRTKGKVAYWQRDTEPASVRHFPADKMREYAEIQKVFYEAVKSVQPDAIVIGGNHNGKFKNGQPENAEFFLYFLKEAKDYFDVLDIRLYGDIYDIEQRVKWFRDAMKKYGYQKPIVCTEMGGPDIRTLSDGIFFKYVRQSRAKGLPGKGNLAPFRRKKKFLRDETPPGRNPLLSKKSSDRFMERTAERNKQLRENLDTAPEKVRVFLEDKIPAEHDIFTDMLCSDIIQRHTIVYACGVESNMVLESSIGRRGPYFWEDASYDT